MKSHHYIISFDPRDGPDNGLTVDRAQELGEKFCAEHFPGHQALVCTHPDGHNHSGNIHVHKTEGYSGADIEGVIRESVESAFAAHKTELATDDILQVIANTHSLSEIMKEPIQKMEQEYQNRKFKNASK